MIFKYFNFSGPVYIQLWGIPNYLNHYNPSAAVPNSIRLTNSKECCSILQINFIAESL